jgi:hypothetical protein
MSNQDIARFYLRRSADLTRSRYMESIYEVLLDRVKNAISNYPWDMGLNGGGSGNLRFPDGTWPAEWMPPSES